MKAKKYMSPECVDKQVESKLHKLPGYCIGNDVFFYNYQKDICSVNTIEDLKELILRWYPLFILGYKKLLTRIRNPNPLIRILCLDVNEEVIKHVIQQNKEQSVQEQQNQTLDKVSDEISEDEATACELILPGIIFWCLYLGKEYQVPLGCALHQGFCDLKDHEECF